MTEANRLEKIAAKAAATLTGSDKSFIERMSAKMGVPFNPRPHCPNCYADQAVLLWKNMKNSKASKKSSPKYILNDGVDVIFRGVRVCASTLTDELAEELLSKGFSKQFFAKV